MVLSFSTSVHLPSLCTFAITSRERLFATQNINLFLNEMLAKQTSLLTAQMVTQQTFIAELQETNQEA